MANQSLLDSTLVKILDVTKGSPVVQPIRPELERVANQLLAALSADIVTILPYNPYWEEFGIPITSGAMEAIVPPYTRDRLRDLMARQHKTTLIEDQAILQELAPRFLQREGIHTLITVCIYSETLPLGIVFVKWRKAHTLSSSEREQLDNLIAVIHKLTTSSHTFNYFIKLLYTEIQFDVVRLHLFKQEQLGTIEEIGQLRWGVRPISKGHLITSTNWSRKTANSSIVKALQRYIDNGQTFLFQDDADDSSSDLSAFTQSEHIQTNGYVLLILNQRTEDEEIVGILFVNWRKKQRWTQAKIAGVRAVARQIALGIHTRRLVTMIKEQSISENWLQELLGRVIRKRSASREEALELVLETAATLTGSYFGDVRLKTGNQLVIEATFGDEQLQRTFRRSYRALPIDGSSLTCEAFRMEDATIFTNAQAEKNYIHALEETRSQMVVIIRHVERGESIGTINLEHKNPYGFNKNDRLRIIAIAEVTAIILQNIERYFHLEEERRSYRMLEEIAVNGLIGANWLHTAGTRSRAIEVSVETIRRQLQRRRYNKGIIENALQNIIKIANDFVLKQRTLPKELQASPTPFLIDQKLKTSLRTLQRSHSFKMKLKLNAGGVKVEVHSVAFNTLLGHLVKNSIQAAATNNITSEIVLETEIDDTFVKITITDNGPGIHGERLKYYLRDRMPEQLRIGASGAGMNIVQFILRRYGGDICYVEQAHGARHEIRLPIKVQ